MKQSNEEKVAIKIVNLLADLRLDLEMVGFFFAGNSGKTIYNRLQEVYEVAQEKMNNGR